MSSPTTIKQEQVSPQLGLYTISPDSPTWSPGQDDRRIPNISIPQLPYPLTPSKSTRPTNAYPTLPDLESPSTSSVTSSTFSRLSTPSDASPRPSPQRVARPCNAFMLFRSDFLKKRTIPDTIESRQQNLSRVIGQVWGLMSDEEKQPWHDLSKEAARKHQELYPDYKFTPAPRGSRSAKNKINKDGKMPEEEISRLREKYTNAKGPAPAPPRTRRKRKARSVEGGDRCQSSPVPTPLPLLTPQPIHALPQSMPARRPSTSLGFHYHHYGKDGSILFPSEPAQAESVDFSGFDMNNIASQPQPFSGLDPSAYATAHHTTALWTASGYQPVSSLGMDAMSSLSIPLPAPYTADNANFFAAQNCPNLLPPATINFDHAYGDGTAAAFASLGIDQDTVAMNTVQWSPEDINAVANWDFSQYTNTDHF